MTTSRIGRKPVEIPSGVEIKVNEDVMSVKGPKGHLNVNIHPFVIVAIEGKEITVSPNLDNDLIITGAGNKLYRSIAGTVRSNIFNVIHGVTQGFEKKLSLIGVGYKAAAKSKTQLSLSLGFSHPTDFTIPDGITIETPTPTEISIKGVDKVLVGQVAASIRRIRPPEPYKGKGVRYVNEVVEIKETKKK